ncbi:MAG TPA: signal peptide peptidase SppA, partial [Candidatus Dojkabacteria bacterium]|nr:signal peptide peptidase SppA [Candidatus Dojkabacteria bacterium]
VDSPGGDVYASKLIYNKIVEFKETGKPVVAFMQDIAASGGYMVSAPADQIVASEVTVTGSIGVIASYVDYEELFDKVGLEQVNIVNTEGKNKAGEDLKDKESEAYILYQGILDDIYDEFIEIVADGRGMTKEEVIELADGRVYTGTQAIENGLIDELGEDKEAYDLIASLASLNNPNFIRYENEENPFSLYSMSLKNILFPELSAIESKKPGLSVQYLMKI